ncbi:MAG: general secretion pathway protein GspB [Candidatus Omnitrophica bacterium]|nr:general secretion pathway protein GspB [Candidatus Omnitrophota bacterium]
MLKKILLVIAISTVFFSSEFCYCALAKKPVAKSPVAKKGGDKAVVADINQVPEVKKIKYKSRSEIKYTGFDAKRDPFCPPAAVGKLLEKPEKLLGFEPLAKDVVLPKIDLQGIIWSKRVPQVIINGGVMNVGDFIEAFEIKEIQRTGIVLFYKGNDYFIKMLGYVRPNKQKKKR